MNYWQRTTIIFTMVVILFFVSPKSTQALPIPTPGKEANSLLEFIKHKIPMMAHLNKYILIFYDLLKYFLIIPLSLD